MIELAAGDAVLTVDPDRGGRFSSLLIAGRELLVGPPDDDDRTILWGSFLMAPWAGRIEGAVLDWKGECHRLAPRDGRHAIHGVTWDRTWTIERAGKADAIMCCSLVPAGWPFGGTVRQHIQLTADRLVAVAEIEAEQAMPAAIGWHPWFLRGPADVRVCVEAATTLETRELIPTGRILPLTETTDLRQGPWLGDRLLDHAYPDAGSPAIVRWPELELQIEFGPPVTTLVVHSRPTAFCVEPQTAWPNAPALDAAGTAGTGLVHLEAGGCLRAEMTWRWRLS